MRLVWPLVSLSALEYKEKRNQKRINVAKMNDTATRPTFVAIVAVVLIAQTVFSFVLFLFVTLVTPDSTIQIIGDSAPMAEVRFEILSTLFILIVVSAYVGRGMWRGDSTARHIFFSSLLALLLIETFARQAMTELPLTGLILAFVVWYLYKKPNVNLFFGGP